MSLTIDRSLGTKTFSKFTAWVCAAPSAGLVHSGLTDRPGLPFQISVMARCPVSLSTTLAITQSMLSARLHGFLLPVTV